MCRSMYCWDGNPHASSLFGWEAIDRDITSQSMERMQLADLAQRPLATLSGGVRQRARIALLLVQVPQAICLTNRCSI